MKLFFLELIVTKKCNQKCSYCNVYPLSKYKTIDNIEVDIDFLKYILNCFNDCNLFLELCGGEPGLISNLDNVYKVLSDTKHIQKIQIMSNGLVRKNGYEWLTNKNLLYNEHNVKEIHNKEILKFYPELDFEKHVNWKYVIVTSKPTINSLLNNYEYFQSVGMFDKHFWYKMLVEKVYSIDGFAEKLKEFYKKLNPDGLEVHLNFINYFLDPNKCKPKKVLCAKNSPLPGVDMETNELMHCCSNLETTKRVKFNKENVELLKHNKLFNYESYCDSCYVFDDSPDKIKCIINPEITNRGYWWND